MTGNRRYSKILMAIILVLAFAASFSVYEVYFSDDRSGGDSELAQSTDEHIDSTEKAVARAAESPEAQSAEKKTKEKSTASQEEGLEEQREDQELADNQLDELAISGSVLDEAGQPVQGATVAAEPANDSRAEDSGSVVSMGGKSTTTNSLGFFEFQDLAEGEYDLVASKGEDFFPASLRVRTGMANAELILQSLRTIRVYGQITDEFGIPLGEVTIRTLGTQFSTNSTEDGRYEIVTAPMRAGTLPVLNFRRKGYQETRERIDAASSSDVEEVELNLQMEPESDGPKVAVAGQVLGPHGEAVVGADIRLKSFKEKKGYSVKSDEFGEFKIPEALVSDGYRLDVLPSEDYEAYQSENLSIGPADEFFEIELEAAGYSSLSGTVTDLNGMPLAGFQLWLRGIGTSAQSPVSVRTDVAGQFRLEQLRAGEVTLETRSRPMLKASKIVLEPGDRKDVHIFLDWGSDWLVGRVVDPRGESVPGASIILQWKEQFFGVLSESRRDLRSDAQGYFTVSNLGAEYYNLTIQAPGYQTYRGQTELGSGSEELQVQLTPLGVSGGVGSE